MFVGLLSHRLNHVSRISVYMGHERDSLDSFLYENKYYLIPATKVVSDHIILCAEKVMSILFLAIAAIIKMTIKTDIITDPKHFMA